MLSGGDRKSLPRLPALPDQDPRRLGQTHIAAGGGDQPFEFALGALIGLRLQMSVEHDRRRSRPALCGAKVRRRIKRAQGGFAGDRETEIEAIGRQYELALSLFLVPRRNRFDSLLERLVVEKAAIAWRDESEAEHASVGVRPTDESKRGDGKMWVGERRAVRRMAGNDFGNRAAQSIVSIAGHDRLAQRLSDERRATQIRHFAADMFEHEPASREHAVRGVRRAARRRTAGFAGCRSAAGLKCAFELGETAAVDRPLGAPCIGRRLAAPKTAARQACRMTDIGRVGGERVERCKRWRISLGGAPDEAHARVVRPEGGKAPRLAAAQRRQDAFVADPAGPRIVRRREDGRRRARKAVAHINLRRRLGFEPFERGAFFAAATARRPGRDQRGEDAIRLWRPVRKRRRRTLRGEGDAEQMLDLENEAHPASSASPPLPSRASL